MGRGNPESRPDYLFSSPSNFFDEATLYKGGVSTEQVREDVVDEKAHLRTTGIVDLSSLLVTEGDHGQDVEVVTRWTCNNCRATFHSSEEQRSHFKSDYHRLNVKRRVVGKEPINEEEFDAVADGMWKGVNDDMSSISGSDDESEDPEQNINQGHLLPRANRIYFVLPDIKEIISVWRCVLLKDKEYLLGEKGSSVAQDIGELCVRDDHLLLRLKSVINSKAENDQSLIHEGQSWVVLLAAGGHFAGIVVKVNGGEVLGHHTFHRYVVRAKAGGRQSTQDKTGRAPKSAGASLRRYNEAALQKEIRDLLASWGGHLQSASHIFVHAPSANGHALFGGENAPLNRNDPRIRRIPFTTRRPTYKEAKRVHHVLAAISYEDKAYSSNEIADGIGDGRKEGSKKGWKAVDIQPGKTKEAISLLNQSAEEANDTVSSSVNVAEHSTSGAQAAEDTTKKEGTKLHVAAKSGDSQLVLKLLEDGMDPSVKDEGGYTPYARATDKETRNMFRRFMAGHPELWDWHAANVPSALTEEMEAAQALKQAEKDTKRKEREKERKKLKKEQERAKEAEKKSAELAAIAVANVRGTAQSKKLFKGPSTSTQSAGYQEALLKAQAQEREMRAAAAEVRMRAMMASKETLHPHTPSTVAHTSHDALKLCSFCGDSLIGKTPFYRLSYQYCSTTCVQVHRKYLESE